MPKIHPTARSHMAQHLPQRPNARTRQDRPGEGRSPWTAITPDTPRASSQSASIIHTQPPGSPHTSSPNLRPPTPRTIFPSELRHYQHHPPPPPFLHLPPLQSSPIPPSRLPPRSSSPCSHLPYRIYGAVVGQGACRAIGRVGAANSRLGALVGPEVDTRGEASAASREGQDPAAGATSSSVPRS